ncbi:serine/threonine kinase PKN8 [Synechococcus phage S-CRM01]|uniref:serine/threonine kinase PKN8 n=1 Tax=Synechococcus phage S-CRM01 TaxID=1026955 RepID=UPI000209E3D3|nr:serine/threonine kinase PKN8 [Synechococcus phage S-CRM01]AEC53076.1 serine/threonine kinase PKN8 [Synechococcus phage S-CRM01]
MISFDQFLSEKKSERLDSKSIKKLKKKVFKQSLSTAKTGYGEFNANDPKAPVIHVKDPRDLLKFGASAVKKQVKDINKSLKLESILSEKELTPAQKKAQELGLKYRGFGYWQNPQTGKTEYKTEGDQLVPINAEKQAELDNEDSEIAMGDPLAQKDSEQQVAAPPGSNILGAPEPGKERPPEDANMPNEMGWDGGPDGNNMINDQEKSEEDEIPPDTYVGSNNNFSWAAGPDGSNFKNMSFDKLVDEALEYITEVRRSQRTQGAKELNSGLNTHGAQLLARNRREQHAKNYSGPLDAGATEWHREGGVGTTDARKQAKRNRDIQQDRSDSNHRREIGAPPRKGLGDMNKVLGGGFTDEEDDHDRIMKDLATLMQPKVDKGYTGVDTQLNNLKNKTGGRTEKAAAAALDKMGTTDRENAMASIENQALQVGRDGPVWDARDFRNKLKELPTIPQKKKDQERVEKMNAELRELLADPDFDISDLKGLNQLGAGAFGSAYLSKTGDHVIKDGHIGPKELKVLHKLKDSPYFPTLVNAIFKSPFSHQSSERNNPNAETRFARAPGEENYPNATDPFGLGPTAEGTYAMTKAKGRPWSRAYRDLDPSTASERAANIWRARAALHQAGISHNDMHGSNVFMDDDGNPTILDLGLANDDPWSALEEALAGYTGEDYQLAGGAQFDDLPVEIQDILATNIKKVKSSLKQRLGIDPDDWDANDDFESKIGRGGIRLTDEDLKELRNNYDLKDEEIIDYISQIYDGLTPKEQSELEQRMSTAYDKRSADTNVIANANHIRKEKGRPPISYPRNVVPKKNLDLSFDPWTIDD